MSWFSRKTLVTPKAVDPPISIDTITKNSSERIDVITGKIRTIDRELKSLRDRISSSYSSPGNNSQNHLRQQAMRLIQQKEMHTQELNTLYMQLSKIEQMNFASKMVDNTINTNKAIKQASANLREQLSSISVSSVEEEYEEMSELMEEYHSLNQAVTFTYNSRWSSPIMDDEQIDAELNNLVDEGMLGGDDEQIPVWLVQPLPSVSKTPIPVDDQFPECPVVKLDNKAGELLYKQSVDDE